MSIEKIREKVFKYIKDNKIKNSTDINLGSILNIYEKDKLDEYIYHFISDNKDMVNLYKDFESNIKPNNIVYTADLAFIKSPIKGIKVLYTILDEYDIAIMFSCIVDHFPRDMHKDYYNLIYYFKNIKAEANNITVGTDVLAFNLEINYISDNESILKATCCTNFSNEERCVNMRDKVTKYVGDFDLELVNKFKKELSKNVISNIKNKTEHDWIIDSIINIDNPPNNEFYYKLITIKSKLEEEYKSKVRKLIDDHKSFNTNNYVYDTLIRSIISNMEFRYAGQKNDIEFNEKRSIIYSLNILHHFILLNNDNYKSFISQLAEKIRLSIVQSNSNENAEYKLTKLMSSNLYCWVDIEWENIKINKVENCCKSYTLDFKILYKYLIDFLNSSDTISIKLDKPIKPKNDIPRLVLALDAIAHKYVINLNSSLYENLYTSGCELRKYINEKVDEYHLEIKNNGKNNIPWIKDYYDKQTPKYKEVFSNNGKILNIISIIRHIQDSLIRFGIKATLDKYECLEINDTGVMINFRKIMKFSENTKLTTECGIEFSDVENR